MKVPPLAGPDAAVIGGAFVLTAVLLGATREAVRFPILRVDRWFFPGVGLAGDPGAGGLCRQSSIVCRVPGLPAEAARRLFLVLVVSLHAVFLRVARI